MTNNITFSVVIPIYKCESSLIELCTRLHVVLASMTSDYEIILVNDACPQDAWTTITHLAKTDKKIKGINLSKNYGQHYAITAGLDHAQGEWIIVMDGDLQDRPEEIVKLAKKANEGFDVVVGQRAERKDSFFKKLGSRCFYYVLNYLTDTTHDASVANFGIYSKRSIQSINRFREHNRAFPLFISIIGFKKTEIPIIHSDRANGKSSYTFKKMIALAVDTALAHSNKPLRISINLGFLISLCSLGYAVLLFVSYFFLNSHVSGWTSVMVSMFFMFGLTFSMFGILGLYIGKIFDEVKRRPLYLIMDTLNLG